MGVIVYYSEISGQKEVKKRQQRVMMILESKSIPYEPIDITDPARENEKDFMLKNAKTKGDAKYVLAPQIFNDEVYCGDFDDFELANENDELESFLKCPKAQNNNIKVANGTSRESSADAEAKVEAPVQNDASDAPAPAASETPAAEESAPATTEEAKEAEPEAGAEGKEADE
ncbi:unnamed protein product [Orchesella dallaii]|uniref:SH3 domain-binding glutamic acid-rich protein n=1 Tax=Orchesella dallaii TaxID=48710 RepID=A0ABP1QLN1_9HEXA